MKRLPLGLLLALGLCSMMTTLPAADTTAKPRPMAVTDLFALKRLAEPQVSPDGKLVIYQITDVSLEQNNSTTALWIAPTDGSAPPKPLTDPKGKKDMHPRWSPDGQQILFESTRPGSSQLFVVAASGGEPIQLTNMSSGASTAIWSPDGKFIAFESTIYPEFSTLPYAEADAKFAEKEKAIADNPVKARTFTKLFFRHWDSYVEDKRRHLFLIEADGKNPRNVTPGDRDAYPNSSTFSVGDDFTFTPDSKHLVFAAAPATEESWSTNYDLCRVSINNTSTTWETLTSANRAADNGPQFSPDGKLLAYRAQRRAGYEADKWELMVVRVQPDGRFEGEPLSLTSAEDLSVDEFAWRSMATGRPSIVFTCEERGTKVIRETTVPVTADEAVGPSKRSEFAGQIGSLSLNSDGSVLVFSKAHLTSPPEVFVNGKNISQANTAMLATLDLPKPESVQVKIEDGEMQMWILKPPGFDATKKYPAMYLIHGGPQGAWDDGWSFRWNAQVWAAQGYVIALPNPRGSTGFGQTFVDQISGDWGGKCYRDLVAGLDTLERMPYVNKDRIGSAGASFGGYMQNWFAVNDISARLRCLVTHCSVWNFESMWGTTDELWFDEYEHGGLPWEVPGKYREFSPHVRAKELGKHKTPMLIIHNDYDFRCPIGQGHELFSALQRQGVPSRFVNFPDEGHWVLKPKNSLHWHQEIFAWLKQHNPPGVE